MRVTIDLDTLTVCEKAEYLRALVFNQRIVRSKYGDYRQTGCYNTFELHSDFEEIRPTDYPFLLDEFGPNDDEMITVTAVENSKLVAMWWWDGDGSLLIWAKGEPQCYENFDCKSVYDWRVRKIKLPVKNI